MFRPFELSAAVGTLSLLTIYVNSLLIFYNMGSAGKEVETTDPWLIRRCEKQYAFLFIFLQGDSKPLNTFSDRHSCLKE